MFVKRAGKFMKALVAALNPDTFTPVSDIAIATVEEPQNVESVIRVFESMGRVEVVTDENGAKSLKLTADGVDWKNAFPLEGA